MIGPKFRDLFAAALLSWLVKRYPNLTANPREGWAAIKVGPYSIMVLHEG